MPRLRLLVFSSLALACGRGRPDHIAPNLVDTTITFIASSSHSGLFPQVRDATRILPGGGVRAALDAPACGLAEPTDTAEWPRVAPSVPSHHLRAVTLRLPSRFNPSPSFDVSEIHEDSTDYWGHILGTWDAFEGRYPNTRLADFAIWIGPNAGYPTAGISGDQVEQVAYAECRLRTAVGVLPVALFTVRSPSPMLGGYFVITYWEIEPGVYLQASGNAPDSAGQADVLAALATVQVAR
jgi:hypothetical protein